MAQEPRRDQPVRLPNPSAQPFVAALKTCRFFAVLFFWVAMVCVLAYAVAFVLTEWVGLYDAPRAAASPGSPAGAAPTTPPAAPSPAASPPAEPSSAPAPAAPAALRALLMERAAEAAEPAASPASGPPTFFGVPAVPGGRSAEKGPPKEAPPVPSPTPKEDETKGQAVARPEKPLPEQPPLTPEQRRARAEHYYDVTLNILRPLRILGVIASFLLGVTLFLFLQIALLGRLSGIRQLTNALFLVILFFATALPWESIFEGFRVNVFYDFPRLVAAHGERLAGNTGDFWEQAKYFTRFLGLPLVSLALLAWSGIQFASGYGESVVANE